MISDRYSSGWGYFFQDFDRFLRFFVWFRFCFLMRRGGRRRRGFYRF